MKYEEIDGDLIKFAKQGMFNVIVHGCNCFCKMKRGLAPQMADAFGCNNYNLEGENYMADMNKLGNLDFQVRDITYDGRVLSVKDIHNRDIVKRVLVIVNAYTQYDWDTKTKPLDYEALALYLRKINYNFEGKRIGLPQIGCHLAGGEWSIVKSMIQKELKDMKKVTIVNYKSE